MFEIINYEKAKKSSAERLKTSVAFKLIEAEAKEIKTKKDDTKYSLKIEKYRAEQKEMRAHNKKYDALKIDITGFNAELTSIDSDAMKSDTTKLNKEIKWTKNIRKDNYIFEVTNVMNDMK